MSWSVNSSALYGLLSAMQRTSMEQQTTMLRLSTSQKINSAADDPDGLIALTRFNSELTAVQAASENASRADAMTSVADGGLSEISDLLGDIQELVVELSSESGYTDAERDAKQLEIDSAIASVNRIASTTMYNGQRLLDGSYDIGTTGVDSSNFSDVQITGRPTSLSSTDFTVAVTTAAEQASVHFQGGHSTVFGDDLTLKVTGELGSVTLTFAETTALSAVASEINSHSDDTGVTVQQGVDTSNWYFTSDNYGDDAYVSVEVVDGATGEYTFVDGDGTDYGLDPTVTVNGQTVGVNGLDVTFNLGGYSGTVTLSESFASLPGSDSFTVTEGGATFALSPDAGNTVTIGIGSYRSNDLGAGAYGYLNQIGTGGSLNALDNPEQALQIVEAARMQVARGRASLGAFQSYTVDGMESVMSSTEQSLSTAISNLNDIDYAMEMADLNRQNVLMQAQMAVFSILNQQTSNIFSLMA